MANDRESLRGRGKINIGEFIYCKNKYQVPNRAEEWKVGFLGDKVFIRRENRLDGNCSGEVENL